MKLEAKANCPLDNFNPCRQLDCAWFMKVRGANPNTGEEIDDYGCSIAWMPVLMIENSQQQRQNQPFISPENASNTPQLRTVNSDRESKSRSQDVIVCN